MESIISVALSSEANPLVNLVQSKEHEDTNLQLNAFFRHFFSAPPATCRFWQAMKQHSLGVKGSKGYNKVNLTYLGLTCWCVKPCSGKRVPGWQPKLHSPGTLCLPVTRQRIIERIWNDHFKLESYIVVL